MALAPPPAQSLALGDHLEDELPEYSDDDIDAIDLELDEDELESETFRWQSPSTQNRQNYHLKLYERFVRAILRRPKDIPPAELRLLAFPDDTELLIKRNKKFLSYVYKKARPRSRATGEHIEYQTLSQYRDSIIFWVPRMYADRGITPPNSSELHAEMTKMMRLVITKYPGAAKQTKEKTWLGLAELRQLLDYEMLNNRCIENSEQHQVAWLIGRTTAVRPGTLCRSKDNRNEVLKWKHLEFTREGDGRFMVIINFVNIAIKNSNDPEKSTRISFKCRIKAPTAENMIFSIPHRLLVIALRRKAVLGVDAEGIDAIDDLLSSDLYNIRICPDFMDQPVFLASKPRGLALNDEGAPLGVPNLSAYLNDRGEALGYIARISYYSIRRRVATELAKKLGPDEARILIGHKPDTWTLEEYYLELGAIYDATAVAFGEEIGPGGFSEEMLKVWAPLAAERLTSQALERTRGAALDALTKQLIMRDPNCPGDDANDLQLKAYRKRVRLYAQKALVAQEADLQHSTVTLTDMQQRRAQFEQSAFAAHVVEKAKIYMDATDVEIDGIDRDEATGEEHQDSRDHETDFQVEPDLESRPLENGAVITFEAEGDVESGAVDEPSSPVSSYETVAKVFMQTIMENTLTAFSMWKDGDRTCTLCIADETMSDEARSKKYDSEGHLKAHMATAQHWPSSRWRRRMQARHDGHPDKLWLCPYCAESSSFDSFAALEQHCANSTVQSQGGEHEELKEVDGWFASDWNGVTEGLSNTKHQRYVHGQNILKAAGFDITASPPLTTSYPHATMPGVVHGHLTDGSIPSRLAAKVIKAGPGVRAVPARLQASVMAVNDGSYGRSEIPDGLEGEIKVVKDEDN